MPKSLNPVLGTMVANSEGGRRSTYIGVPGSSGLKQADQHRQENSSSVVRTKEI
ncbi:MAG TPA: hypothetical protein VEW46_04935 [Pyrinomonadaceae bacterium]|nr:hypothetical protein [Pyrinomonadaceae bacterium]